MIFKNIKKMALITVPAVFFVILDRFLKVLAIKYFYSHNFNLAGSFFSFGFAKNYNIAFSLPMSGWWLNILIILIILSLLFYFIHIIKGRDYYRSLFLLFIIIGAISNLYDRLAYGYVIDYFDLKYFTVLNLADMIIVGGVAGIILKIFKDKQLKKQEV